MRTVAGLAIAVIGFHHAKRLPNGRPVEGDTMRHLFALFLLVFIVMGAVMIMLVGSRAPKRVVVADVPSPTTVAVAAANANTPTAVAPANTPVPTVPPAPPTYTPLPPPPPTLALDTTQVKKQLAQVEADTSRMRGLSAKAQVPEHFMSSDEINYNMMQQTLQEYTPEQAKRDATRLWLLLFIDDRSTDFRQMQIEFDSQEVLGFYDQIKKELFVRTDGSSLSPGARETLAHEYVHSLQDQHFNLQKMLPPGVDHDRDLATRAIVEGDATISGLLYASKYMSQGDFAQMYREMSSGGQASGVPVVPTRAPVYLQEEWQFPYREGSDFAFSAYETGGYKQVNSVLADPPASTEQIMHPEKYFQTPRDTPMPVALPPLTDTLGTGWKFAETDTLGEFDLQIMLRENYVDRPEASEGWGGARYDLYENANGTDALAIMGSRWDTDKDASEFYDALDNSFKLYEKIEGLWHAHGRAWGMKRTGDMVVLVSGTKVDDVLKAMALVK